MNKKILDFPEAAELANDDYIIFDSESGGGCRIKAKKITPVILGIEAIYTQTQEVTPDTPLNDLKQDLVVKAVYRNNRKKVVTDYTLSGTLAVGTSTITVTYANQTTTFEVEVTQATNYIFNWNFKESLVDSVHNKTAVLGGSATRNSDGVYIGLANDYIIFMDSTTANAYSLRPTVNNNLILEVDFGELNKYNAGATNYRFLMWDDDEGLIFRGYSSKWEIYQRGDWNSITWADSSEAFNSKLFKNSTVKFVFTTGDFYIYKNNAFVGSSKNIYNNSKEMFWMFGSTSGNAYRYATVEGIRIYFEEV